MADRTDISFFIKTLIAKELNREVAEIQDETTFHDLGLDSVNSIFLLGDLEEHYAIDIDPLSLFDNPTIASFSTYVYAVIHGAR